MVRLTIRVEMVGERYSRCVKSYKGHDKCIFETPNNEMKWVLGIKESYLIAKIASKFSGHQPDHKKTVFRTSQLPRKSGHYDLRRYLTCLPNWAKWEHISLIQLKMESLKVAG